MDSPWASEGLLQNELKSARAVLSWSGCPQLSRRHLCPSNSVSSAGCITWVRDSSVWLTCHTLVRKSLSGRGTIRSLRWQSRRLRARRVDRHTQTTGQRTAAVQTRRMRKSKRTSGQPRIGSLGDLDADAERRAGCKKGAKGEGANLSQHRR